LEAETRALGLVEEGVVEEEVVRDHSVDVAGAGNDVEDDHEDTFHRALRLDEGNYRETYCRGGHGIGFVHEEVLHRPERDGDSCNDACRCACHSDELRGA